MASTRSVTSRFSSPQTAGIAANAGKELQGSIAGQRAFMQKWLEPPVQNKASFQEVGLARAGVVEHMLPLGTVPRASHIRRLAEKASASLEDVAGSRASTVEPAETISEEDREQNGESDYDDEPRGNTEDEISRAGLMGEKDVMTTAMGAERRSYDAEGIDKEASRKKGRVETRDDGECEDGEVEEGKDKQEVRVEDRSEGEDRIRRSNGGKRARRRRSSRYSVQKELPKKKFPPSHLLLKMATRLPPSRKIILKTSQSHSQPRSHSLPSSPSPSLAPPTTVPTLVLKPPPFSSLPIHSLSPPKRLIHATTSSQSSPLIPSSPLPHIYIPSPSEILLLRASSLLDEDRQLPQIQTNHHNSPEPCSAMLPRRKGGRAAGQANQNASESATPCTRSLRPRRAAAVAATAAIHATQASSDGNNSDASGGTKRRRENNSNWSQPASTAAAVASTPAPGALDFGPPKEYFDLADGLDSPVSHSASVASAASTPEAGPAPRADQNPFAAVNPSHFKVGQVEDAVSRAVRVSRQHKNYLTAYALRTMMDRRSGNDNLRLLRLAMRFEGPRNEKERDDFRRFARIIKELKEEGDVGPAYKEGDERGQALPISVVFRAQYDILSAAGFPGTNLNPGQEESKKDKVEDDVQMPPIKRQKTHHSHYCSTYVSRSPSPARPLASLLSASSSSRVKEEERPEAEKEDLITASSDGDGCDSGDGAATPAVTVSARATRSTKQRQENDKGNSTSHTDTNTNAHVNIQTHGNGNYSGCTTTVTAKPIKGTTAKIKIDQQKKTQQDGGVGQGCSKTLAKPKMTVMLKTNTKIRATRSKGNKHGSPEKTKTNSMHTDSDSELSDIPSEMAEELHEAFGDQSTSDVETPVTEPPIRWQPGSLTSGAATSPSQCPSQPPSASTVVAPSIAAASDTTSAASDGKAIKAGNANSDNKAKTGSAGNSSSTTAGRSSRSVIASNVRTRTQAPKKSVAKIKAHSKKKDIIVPQDVNDEQGYAAQRRSNHDWVSDVLRQEVRTSDLRFDLCFDGRSCRGSELLKLAPDTPPGRKRGRDEEDTVMPPLEPPSKRPVRSAAVSRATTPALSCKGQGHVQVRSNNPRFKTSPVKGRNAGPAAGIARRNDYHGANPATATSGFTAAGPSVPAATPFSAEDNDDLCGACGAPGELLCCESCPTSMHPSCLDPPLESIEECPGSFFCQPCKFKRRHASGARPLPAMHGPFAQLIRNLESQNTKSIFLPVDVRECFDDVQTGVDGEYEEAPPKHNLKTRTGYVDEPDFYAVKDKHGNHRICHGCNKGPNKMLGETPMEVITCLFCGLNWHPECCHPPLAKAPTGAQYKTWKCPAHIDPPILHGSAHSKFRILKNKDVIVPAYSRGTMNHGVIDVLQDSEDEKTKDCPVYNFQEKDDYGVRYQLSSAAIKLDFLSAAKHDGRDSGKKNAARKRVGKKESDFCGSSAPHAKQNTKASGPSADQQDAAISLMLMSRERADPKPEPRPEPQVISVGNEAASNATNVEKQLISDDDMISSFQSHVDSGLLSIMVNMQLGNAICPSDRQKVLAFLRDMQGMAKSGSTDKATHNSRAVDSSSSSIPVMTQTSTALSTAASTPSKMDGDLEMSEAVESPKTPDATRYDTTKANASRKTEKVSSLPKDIEIADSEGEDDEDVQVD